MPILVLRQCLRLALYLFERDMLVFVLMEVRVRGGDVVKSIQLRQGGSIDAPKMPPYIPTVSRRP